MPRTSPKSKWVARLLAEGRGNRMFRTSGAGSGFVASAARRNRAPKIKGAIPARKELKYVDVGAANYAADTTGSVTLLNGIAVGDDNTTRDGRQVTIKSVQLHGRLGPETAAQAACKARVMLVWDNAASGVIATIAQILSGGTSNAFPLVDNANRFTILHDKTYTLGGQDTTTATIAWVQTPVTFDVEVYKRLSTVTQYNGTGATIAAVQNGALLLVTIGDAAAGGNFVLASRVRFTDD